MQLGVFLGVCGALLVACYVYVRRRRQRRPLPPGPKRLPVLGNMLDMPAQKPWETYARWGREYGEVVYMSSMGKSFVIVNSFAAACELLERKSSIYSGRPRFPILELMGFSRETALLPPGNLWKMHRTLYKQQFTQSAIRTFRQRQTEAAHQLLRSILDAPAEYRQHLRHMVADTVLNIAYGHDVSPQADQFVTLAERTVEAFSLGVRPGAYLVNLIPALRHVPEWMPGAHFQTFARESRSLLAESKNVPFEDVKRRLAAGTARASFVTSALADLETKGGGGGGGDVPEDAIKSVAGGMYRGERSPTFLDDSAGSDTTTSSLSSFVLAMVMYPEVQKIAQAELDRVVGKERLPDFTDREHLPYVEGVVKEVLRWNPPVPLGVPHAVTEDDVYRGYHIPKGTTVIGNAWAILHDPEMYADPETFRPDRFIPDKWGRTERDPAITGTFGYGRRICAGRYVADASLWIGVVSLLAAFNMSPAKDEHGHVIDVHYALDPPPGALVHPRPFPCSITPRTPAAEKLIRQTEHSSQRRSTAA